MFLRDKAVMAPARRLGSPTTIITGIARGSRDGALADSRRSSCARTAFDQGILRHMLLERAQGEGTRV